MGDLQKQENFDGKMHRAWLESYLSRIEAGGRILPQEERAIWVEHILEPLENASDQHTGPLRFAMGLQVVCGLNLGFWPSEYLVFLQKRFGDKPSASEETKKASGELNFWWACALFLIGEKELTMERLEKVEADALVSGKIQLAALVLKAWCLTYLDDYGKALDILESLKEEVHSQNLREQLNFLAGYITAAWTYGTGAGIAEEEEESNELFFTYPVILPDTEFDESLARPSPMLTAQKMDEMMSFMSNKFDQVNLNVWKAKEEIISKKPNTQTLEEVNERLAKEYGDWTKRIQNLSALVNAEFLFSALSARSWGEVVAGYANAVEAELRTRILNQLEGSLRTRQGNALLCPGINEIESHKCDLGDAEKILRNLESNHVAKELFSSVSIEARSFLLGELPTLLAQLRTLRNPAVHGNIVQSAKEARRLVLGTPEKSGLLKRLCEIRLNREAKP